MMILYTKIIMQSIEQSRKKKPSENLERSRAPSQVMSIQILQIEITISTML